MRDRLACNMENLGRTRFESSGKEGREGNHVSRPALALLVALAACATLGVAAGPGRVVTPADAERWGCDYEEVMAMTENAKQNASSSDRYFVPQPEWTACQVLATVGAPNDVDSQSVAGRRSVSWWFRSGYDSHLVSLVSTDRCDARDTSPAVTDTTLMARIDRALAGATCSPWVVDYVGW